MNFVNVLLDLHGTQTFSFLRLFVTESLPLERVNTLFVQLFDLIVNLANLDISLATVVGTMVGNRGTAAAVGVRVFSLVKAQVVLATALLILVLFEL